MLSAKIWQEQGMKQREISSRLGVSERTARNYIKASDTRPERKARHREDMKKRFRIINRLRRRNSAVDVEVRHPSIYDAVVSGGVQ